MSRLLLLALLGYGGWLLLLFALQRELVFPARGLPVLDGVDRSLPGLRAFHLPLPEGEALAWFLPPAGGGRGPALLFTHGNAELIDYAAADMASFARAGLGVLLVEYPGYGRARGRPSARSIEAAVVAAYDVLAVQPEVDPERIVGYGRSLGTGAAARLSERRPLAALVLQAPFTSLRAFAARYLAPGFLVRDRFEVLETVRGFEGPVLVVHGRRDPVVPYAHGEAVARAAPLGRLVTHDCGHNDCPPDWEAHVAQVSDFLRESGVLTASP